MMSLPHSVEFERIADQFRRLGSVVVGFSGGVDSALLMKIGTLAIGRDCLGVLVQGRALSRDDRRDAETLAREQDFALRVLAFDELALDNFVRNPPDRCYFCKRAIIAHLLGLARDVGAAAVMHGAHADDLGDGRPGQRAAEEQGVLSPLREAGLGKVAVRELARALGLPNWDRPASPCLATRIEFGLPITPERLEQVERGEIFLHERGFRLVRVRHHGDRARIEVAPDQVACLGEPALREALTRHLRALGFQQVEIAPDGYRMGRLMDEA